MVLLTMVFTVLCLGIIKDFDLMPELNWNTEYKQYSSPTKVVKETVVNNITNEIVKEPVWNVESRDNYVCVTNENGERTCKGETI